MTNVKKTAALAALMALASGGAAQATEGWYGRVDAGYSTDGDLDFQDSGPGYELDDDGLWGIGAGYAYANGFRLEAAYTELESDMINKLTGPTPFGVTSSALMANLYYDFNRGGWFEPYIGIGAGVTDFDFSGSPTAAADTAFAWQALAGVAIGLTQQLDLDIGYRYLEADDVDFEEFGIGGQQFDYDYQAATIGLRYQFSGPAPAAAAPPADTPPPAPVATCPQSDFVVYFEWDRSALNSQALEVIDSAVARARECNISSATLVGHTDTSGAPAYNVALSESRASVVRDALVARGLAASLITTEAHGETDLARPTADGVREPLNRRTAVTITFQ
jgi:outer membrane protein OmpA-like peptidoglycan-associated protein/outer membrane protein W